MRTYTIGYIEHDEVIHSRYLGPSIDSLSTEVDVISTSDEDFPAKNYNQMLRDCKTDYIILTHQDVSFPPDLIERIDETLNVLMEDDIQVGCLGMVGMDPNHSYLQRHSTLKGIYEVDTLDCCFVVVDPKLDARFDEQNFGEYHLYVEDYCAQMNRALNRKNFTILIESGVDDIMDKDYVHDFKKDRLRHHSATVSKVGSAWGLYWQFKDCLIKKWGKIKTT